MNIKMIKKCMNVKQSLLYSTQNPLHKLDSPIY